MIDTITIERFKNISRIALKLENINILVGANNAGKSSILQGIQFAVAVAQTTSLDEFSTVGWKNSILSTSLTANQIIYSPIKDIYALGSGGSLSQDADKAIMVEFAERDSGHLAKFSLRKGRNKNLLTSIEGKDLGNTIRYLDNPYSIYVPGLSGIPAAEELKSEGVVRRLAAKGDANNVFRNVLWLLKQDTNKWDAFILDFKDIFPELDITITFDKIKDEYLNAFITSNSKSFPIDAFGTGVLQIIQILSYIHLYNPKLLILDEPDSHLHPSNQKILAEKLNDITARLNFQIIISTHSRHLLDSFRDYAAVHWISNGALNNQDYSFISVLLEIGALDRGDILNKGSSKCVILTEDARTEKLKSVLAANNFNLAETELWSYEGCSKLDTAIVLAAFIKKSAPGTTVLVHRDRDYLTDEECDLIASKASAANIEIMFTIGTDIESHLLNPHHITKVYTQLNLEQVENLIDKATDKVEEKSLRNFINAATQDALQKQYAGGARVDNGQIALDCTSKYRANKPRYRHGKQVFKILRNQLEVSFGKGDLSIATEDLKLQSILDIQARIWPAS
ncbi:MAG TPA: ATP-binding protein [Hymenobacter sp.]|uniref:AAA family ATPase n=1 Tax=Hymenobacter sp. TaxID=1898978 RepID=UPI002D7FD420|nr:ATP-binding protein [Hymenobacter sp.]HET9506173.1 ATP-binding protein [Hymenobacter sp.]